MGRVVSQHSRVCLVGWKGGGMEKGEGKKGVFPFLVWWKQGRLEKGVGGHFPPGPTIDHSPKLGGKFGENVCFMEITIFPFILFSCFFDTYYKNFFFSKK